ncbi:MAG: hypothetical protein OHK0057_32030 [Thermoflexibacter sp.]
MRQNYPSFKHQLVSCNLYAHFYNYVKEKNLVIVLHAPFGVVLDETKVLQPDIIYIASANKEIVKEEEIMGVPDLLVEIYLPKFYQNR